MMERLDAIILNLFIFLQMKSFCVVISGELLSINMQHKYEVFDWFVQLVKSTLNLNTKMMMKEILETVDHSFSQSDATHRGTKDQLVNHQLILDNYDHFHYDFQDTFISHHSHNYPGVSVISSIISPIIMQRAINIDINQSVDRYLNIDTNHIHMYEHNDGLPGGYQQTSNNHNSSQIIQHHIQSHLDQQINLQTEQDNTNSPDETKNIPKNFIKAIFSYILQNKDDLVFKVFDHIGCSQEVERFMEFIGSERKIKKYTIERLKNWWVYNKYEKAMRIICCRFLRKRSLSYIMTSKIEKKLSHLKYRQRFVKSMQRPQDFTNIK